MRARAAPSLFAVHAPAKPSDYIRAARPLRADATRAPITRLSASASGCHWTPSANGSDGSSIASGRSSMTAHPVTSSPSPRRPRGLRARGQADVVVGLVEAADDAPVLGVAEVVGQVLAQRPAAGDVEH